MVIDLKRFSPGQELQAGLLTVVEQMPGLVVAADKTQVSSTAVIQRSLIAVALLNGKHPRRCTDKAMQHKFQR